MHPFGRVCSRCGTAGVNAWDGRPQARRQTAIHRFPGPSCGPVGVRVHRAGVRSLDEDVRPGSGRMGERVLQPGPPVVVVGAHGGVGASTLTALLALTAGPERTALVDLAGGGGLDVLLGIEGHTGVRWPALAGVRGTIEPGDLAGALPRWRDIPVLSSARDDPTRGPDAVLEVLAALSAEHQVFVDLAASELAGPVGDAVVSASACVVLLAAQDVTGVAAVLRTRTDEPRADRLVLRRRRSRTAPIEAAHVVDLPLIGMLPNDRRVADAVERGWGPLPGRRLQRAVGSIWRRTGGLR